MLNKLFFSKATNLIFQNTHRFFVKHNVSRLRPKKYIVQEKEVKLIDFTIFDNTSKDKLNILQSAFFELKGDDSRVCNIEQYSEEEDNFLHIEIKEFGSYMFRVIKSEQVLYMSSPISGINKYS